MPSSHIAFLPARKGSAGFPGKNRLFFDRKAQFVVTSGLFDRVIVSTNDEVIKANAKENNFSIHNRNEFLSGSDIAIKQVAENMVEEMKISQTDYIWLIYINVLYENLEDFRKTKEL